MRTTIECISSKRCWLIFGVFAVVATMMALTPGTVRAQATGTTPVDDPNGPFQLEGNAVTDSSICFELDSSGAHLAAPPCGSGFSLITFSGSSDDWDKVFAKTSHSLATSFVNDPVGGNDNILTQPGGGGGAKDTNGFGVWTWKAGKVVKPQAKDDIENAFAAAYTATNGDTLIYFGMDRFDNSGDSTGGFWFVQDPNVGGGLEQCGTPTSPALCSVTANGFFGGHHTDGDLLIVSDFPQGGALSTIRVFKWSGDDSGSLVASTDLTSGATCDPATHTSTLCGVVNGNDGIAAGGWGFSDKGGNSTFAHGEFLEGGINLNAIFGSNLPCFSKFFAETRSSTSPTASLSDVTTPVSFPLCGATINKACSTAAFADNGTDVLYTFTGMIKNTGIAGLKNLVVSDVPGGTFNGTLSITQPDLSSQPTPGVLASGATVTYSGSFKASTASSTQPNSVFLDAQDVNGTAVQTCTDSGGSAHTACGSWPTPLGSTCIPPVGTLGITKTCSVAVVSTGTALEIQVNFSGTVTNNSGVQITGLTVADNPSASITLGTTTLIPNGSTNYSGSYTPTSCSTTDGGVCSFTDTAQAQGTGGAGAGTISSTATSATCHLCPAGVCSASSQ